MNGQAQRIDTSVLESWSAEWCVVLLALRIADQIRTDAARGDAARFDKPNSRWGLSSCVRRGLIRGDAARGWQITPSGQDKLAEIERIMQAHDLEQASA